MLEPIFFESYLSNILYLDYLLQIFQIKNLILILIRWHQKNDIFSLKSDARTLPELRLNKEIKMSRLILERGWNIGCLMKYYNGVDFRFLTTSWTDYKPFLGDVMTTKNFSDKLFNNFFELVFIKGSRFDNNIHGIKLT
jgi:hypothetical protein